MDARAPRNPTMLDVAKAAGVSRAMVSIVMRDAPGARPDTRAHVKRVAEELGYVPDARAQALRSSRKAIGVALRPDQPFHAALIDGIYARAEADRYPVVLSAVTSKRDEQQAIESLINNRCGAVITIGSELSAKRLGQYAQRVPVIVAATVAPAPGVDTVSSDDEAGLVQAVDHLVSLGHREIWFCASKGSGGDPQRRAGYEKGMAAHGLATHVVEAGFTEESGATAGAQLLEAPELPTAVIGFNDACAAGIQAVLVRGGVRIPEDVSLMGYDDADISRVSYRDLSTIRQDFGAIASYAVALAEERMGGAPAHDDPHLLPTELVVRSSTAKPRASRDVR